MEMEMGFTFLSFFGPIIALLIGGAITLGLDWWRRRK